MATKKSSKAGASSNDMAVFWKWLYVAGVVIAGVMGMNLIPFLNSDAVKWILLLVGLLVGFFYFDSSDLMNFGLRYLILGAVATAAFSFIGVGTYVGGFLTGFYAFLGPVIFAQIIMFFAKKYFM
jgi:hypothetical protein